ncbi:hypothetical protein GN244_ATG15964 [Phytophthora infestans]|uniref:Secreted RxLR effector peptide protein n=1 Tax=Phytophthora infestans TaxID=4787 RepID=A0A833VWY2_PHYIN|nr:hypothetical protein GN244_ATG15964 [Phytophthora infestans]
MEEALRMTSTVLRLVAIFAVGIDEAASLETVAGHGTRGGRRKGGVRQAPNTCTGNQVAGRAVRDGVDTGGAAGHTAVAGRVPRGRGAGEGRGGRTARRVPWIAVMVVTLVGEAVVRGVVDLEEVVEGRRLVELRVRPLQKVCSELRDGVSMDADSDNTVTETP